MEPTLPVLPRMDRLDRLLQLLEEKHSKSTRFGSTTTNNGSHDDDHDHEDNHKEKLEDQMNCKTLLSALDDVHHKGTLIDRLSMLENRVLKLILDMEERSTSRSSSSTAYATREENEFPIDNCAKKTIGKGKRKISSTSTGLKHPCGLSATLGTINNSTGLIVTLGTISSLSGLTACPKVISMS